MLNMAETPIGFKKLRNEKEDEIMEVFISQPMRGKTVDEIKAEREKAIEEVKRAYPGEEIEVIDSIRSDANKYAPLANLANSLELMAGADIVYFAKGWEEARGCSIEFECAFSYGIEFMCAI